MDKKILILLPIWKREAITKICFDNLKKLQEDFNIIVLCIVSERWAKLLAFKYRFEIVEAPNECLGTKMNIGVQKAFKYDFDYLMNLGSDDIITKELFECYQPYFKLNKVMFGPTRLTFIDSESKGTKTFDYELMIGAGRCIRKDILVKCVVKDGKVDMYDKIQSCLDLNSLRRFDKYSHTEIRNPFETIFDIKSKINIWPYEQLRGQHIEFDTATKTLSADLLDAILEL